MSHWAIQYIGRPHRRGAIGPTEFDCLSFTRHVQLNHYAVEMPLLHIEDYDEWHKSSLLMMNHEERLNWFRVDDPSDGDVTLLARSRLPIHIGTWIRANRTEGVLHCTEGIGVTFQTARELRVGGWGSLQHYRHKSHAND